MYFKNFPSLVYNEHDGITSGVRVATDILTRVAFTSEGITGSEHFINYIVKDQDTPETVAYSVYGSAEYHWLVLLFNNIFNPFFEWPMSSSRFEKHLQTKYAGVSLFMRSVAGVSGTFRYNDTVVLTNESSGATALGRVTSYDPTLSKVTITDITPQGTVLDSSWNDADIKAYNATGGAELTNNTGEGTIERLVLDSTAALHHFETSGSVTAGYNDVGGGTGTSTLILDPLSKYDGITQVGLNEGAGITQTLLYAYTNSSSDAYVVTNRDYENSVNETNRTIKLIMPELLPTVIQNFKSLVK